MFQAEIIAITPDWPAWVFITIYVTIGFLVGLAAIWDGNCESPVGTLIFAVFAGPIMAAVALLVASVIAPFWFVVWAFGIESSQSDTHGV